MTGAQRRCAALLALLAAAYVAIFVPPNRTGSANVNMLGVFQVDEFAQYHALWRMTEPAESAAAATRVPGHSTANISLGIDVLRGATRRPKLSFQIDVENVGNNLYLIAQESEFTPGQFSIPRLVSVTAKLRF